MGKRGQKSGMRKGQKSGKTKTKEEGSKSKRLLF